MARIRADFEVCYKLLNCDLILAILLLTACKIMKYSLKSLEMFTNCLTVIFDNCGVQIILNVDVNGADLLKSGQN